MDHKTILVELTIPIANLRHPQEILEAQYSYLTIAMLYISQFIANRDPVYVFWWLIVQGIDTENI